MAQRFIVFIGKVPSIKLYLMTNNHKPENAGMHFLLVASSKFDAEDAVIVAGCNEEGC
ncbi:hypothetical protein D3C72_2593510 [compost metagenome]